MELTGIIAGIVHLACHLGAIRQIDAAARGPLARDYSAARLCRRLQRRPTMENPPVLRRRGIPNTTNTSEFRV
jgi:hypothetical protein